ncbi:ABC transporter ATP-binding protein [Acidianus manzaensis]|uniref:ABC transporter domain-containing protein n=1 Tax=Acidianus manzaensis TaxID=282676 RepID=A0A1W6K2S3_9CREN|nr:ATP-binding cassette domain-containing protein [Acidianus manzaensis]ARM76795.1 hypothetical protein B6F84_12720 [Acidianus manzaensis]
MSFVFIKDLEVTYPDNEYPSIQIPELKINEGESVLITGKSGCGKSTLINVINGIIPKLIEADVKGEIKIFGEDISSLSVHQISKRVGTLLQDPDSQILNYFVKDEIAFPLQNLNYSKEEILKRINEVTDWVGIKHLLNRETFTLSGGEKQRTVLASILAMNPKALILDEPTSSLDSKATKDVIDKIKDIIKSDGVKSRNEERVKSIIIVEHKVTKVLPFVDRILVMDKGKIIYDLRKNDAILMAEELEKIGIEMPIRRKENIQRREGKIVLNATIKVTKDTHYLVNTEVSLSEGITALMGVNGSGKSTLLKAIAGLLPKDLKFEGSISIENKNNIEKMKIDKRGKLIAYLPQDVDLLFIKRTVEKELAYSMKLRNKKINESILQKYLNDFSLTEVKDRDPLLLSIGQKRRTALAITMISNVKVLLLDEPTTGQDWYHRKMLGEDLRKLKGVAILVVTHDPRFTYYYTDNVLLMDNGKIVYSGKPEEALKVASKEEIISEEELKEIEG